MRRLQTRTWIAAVVALALLVRMLVIIATPNLVPRTDAHEYDQNAVSLVTHGRFAPSTATFHGGPTAIHPPLWSLTLAGVYKVVGTSSKHTRWIAGRVFEAVLGALAVWLMMLLGRRLFGRTPALVAGGIAAVYPPLVVVGSTLMSEPVFIVLVLAAVLVALMHRSAPRGLWWPVAAGILVGLAALTRGNGIVLVLPLGFLVWVRSRDGAWRAPLALVCAALITLVPWTIRNFEDFHQFVPVTTETGFAVAGVYDTVAQHQNRFPALWLPPFAEIAKLDLAHPKITEAQMSDHMWSYGLRYLGHHPGSLAKTLYWNARRMLDLNPEFERFLAASESYPQGLAVASAYAFWVLLAILVAGLLSVPVRGAARRASVWIWMCPLLLNLVALPLEESTRYRSPADPFLLLFAGLTLAEAGARLRARRAPREATGTAVAG